MSRLINEKINTSEIDINVIDEKEVSSPKISACRRLEDAGIVSRDEEEGKNRREELESYTKRSCRLLPPECCMSLLFLPQLCSCRPLHRKCAHRPSLGASGLFPGTTGAD
jgi:hypothetical protein